MKNIIEEKIKIIKKQNRLGLMTHIVVGYPDLDESFNIATTMDKNGADFIELQIPFSDPMADGSTIMEANKIALENNTKINNVFDFAKKLDKNSNAALILMTYFNIILNLGVENFCKKASESGISGLIIPDFQIENESEERLEFYANKYNLINIRVLSPASTEKRIKLNSLNSSGLVYLASRKGTTGAKNNFDKGLDENIDRLKKYFKIPVAVGFGISKPEHINLLKKKADIAVIGSAFIEIYKEKKIKGISDFMKKIDLTV